MIREATPADVPRVVEMGRRFLAEGPYRDKIADNPEVCAKLAAQLVQNPQAKILVAEEGEQLIGILVFILFPHYFSGEMTAGELVWWVEPRARGRTGVKLLTAAEGMARDLGAKRMQMVAPTLEVGRLYKRRGYEEVETTYQRSL